MQLSIIVPMLNEEPGIVRTLDALRAAAPRAEIIVVDGGSHDLSVPLAHPHADRVIDGPRGRARQMNLGARDSHGDVLAFVHADTVVPPTFALDIETALRDPAAVGGRFDVALDHDTFIFRLIGALISVRSRASRTGTGDQALFVRRSVFERLGGYREIDICEDLDFARRLKREGRIACVRSRVITSARRWREHGVARTVLTMWAIRVAFLCGVPPARLKRHYADIG
ncbi:MAG: TIGR04283 family arsenosugar biosynthesis glycosyltransferase [Candidatus Binataceae bacterium]